MAKVIPFAPIERLIRTAGAHRVSESAGVTLTEILEEYGLEISREAIKLAEHAGRKTVKAEDIKLAKEMILNLTQHVTTDEQEAQLVVEPRMTKRKNPLTIIKPSRY